MLTINWQGAKDNLQHLAGLAIGRLVLRRTGHRYTKADRGIRWFSTVAANLSADGEVVDRSPYRVFNRRRRIPR